MLNIIYSSFVTRIHLVIVHYNDRTKTWNHIWRQKAYIAKKVTWLETLPPFLGLFDNRIYSENKKHLCGISCSDLQLKMKPHLLETKWLWDSYLNTPQFSTPILNKTVNVMGIVLSYTNAKSQISCQNNEKGKNGLEHLITCDCPRKPAGMMYQ